MMTYRVDKEQEWFMKQEKEMLVRAAREERERHFKALQAKLDAEELKRLRKPHWLKCPKCGHAMEMTRLEGIEIDRRTFCEGVYFDRWALETLLLRE